MFWRAVTIYITGLHSDRFAHLSLRQDIGIVDGTNNGTAVSLPPVADVAQPIQVRQRIGRSQCLAPQSRASEGDTPRGQVVDIEHRHTGAAGHKFGLAMAIGITHTDRNDFANQCFTQHQTAARGPTDGVAISMPLVTEMAQTIAVGQAAGNGIQGLTLLQGANQCYCAGGRVAETNVAAMGIKLSCCVNTVKQNSDICAGCGISAYQQGGNAAATSQLHLTLRQRQTITRCGHRCQLHTNTYYVTINKVADRVQTIATGRIAKHISACSALQVVRARATSQNIIAGQTNQQVITTIAVQIIVARCTRERLVALGAGATGPSERQRKVSLNTESLRVGGGDLDRIRVDDPLRYHARQGMGCRVVAQPGWQWSAIDGGDIGKFGIGVVNIIKRGIQQEAEQRQAIIHINLVADAASGCVVNGLNIEGDRTRDQATLVVLHGISKCPGAAIVVLRWGVA